MPTTPDLASARERDGADQPTGFRAIEINPRRMRGVPVIRDHRFPVAQLLAELAEWSSAPEEFAARFSTIEPQEVRDVLNDLATWLHQNPAALAAYPVSYDDAESAET